MHRNEHDYDPLSLVGPWRSCPSWWSWRSSQLCRSPLINDALIIDHLMIAKTDGFWDTCSIKAYWRHDKWSPGEMRRCGESYCEKLQPWDRDVSTVLQRYIEVTPQVAGPLDTSAFNNNPMPTVLNTVAFATMVIIDLSCVWLLVLLCPSTIGCMQQSTCHCRLIAHWNCGSNAMDLRGCFDSFTGIGSTKVVVGRREITVDAVERVRWRQWNRV